MNNIATRTPDVIAAEIESIKLQTRNFILQSSVEIGGRLVEAKKMVAHGEWSKWLVESVDYSQSTANNLMKIHKEYSSNSQTFGNLSYSKAVALLGVPTEEREQFVEENNVEGMSTKKLQQVIKEKQQMEKRLQKSNAEAEAGRKAQEEVNRLKIQLTDAKADDKTEEVNELNKKISQLEAELKKKPIDVPSIPEEVQKELDDLRKQAEKPKGEKSAKFKVQFESLATNFKSLLQTLGEVKTEDIMTYEKYQKALSNLIESMEERLVK